MVMDQEYCDNPRCPRPAETLDSGAVAVRPRTVDEDFGTSLNRPLIGDQVLYVHPTCFDRNIYIRARV